MRNGGFLKFVPVVGLSSFTFFCRFSERVKPLDLLVSNTLMIAFWTRRVGKRLKIFETWGWSSSSCPFFCVKPVRWDPGVGLLYRDGTWTLVLLPHCEWHSLRFIYCVLFSQLNDWVVEFEDSDVWLCDVGDQRNSLASGMGNPCEFHQDLEILACYKLYFSEHQLEDLVVDVRFCWRNHPPWPLGTSCFLFIEMVFQKNGTNTRTCGKRDVPTMSSTDV